MSAIKFTPSEEHDVADLLSREARAACELAASHGYRREHFDAVTWHCLIEAAGRTLFLNEPNRYLADGAPTQRALVHTIDAPNLRLAEGLLAAITAAHPDLASIRIYRPTEVLADRVIYIEHRVLMTAERVSAVSCALVVEAMKWCCQYEGWRPQWESDVQDALMPCRTAISAEERKKLTLRTEFVSDVLLVRLVLAPYVWRWLDFDTSSAAMASKSPAVSSGLDHTVVLELNDQAPELDHLRWLLWQVPDLHVAAQSLDYTACYTGERLDYRLMDHLMPELEVLNTLQEAFKALWEVSKGLQSRLSELAPALFLDEAADELDDDEPDIAVEGAYFDDADGADDSDGRRGSLH
jgi:hypothetical protein